jgi:hypothetical protein
MCVLIGVRVHSGWARPEPSGRRVRPWPRGRCAAAAGAWRCRECRRRPRPDPTPPRQPRRPVREHDVQGLLGGGGEGGIRQGCRGHGGIRSCDTDGSGRRMCARWTDIALCVLEEGWRTNADCGRGWARGQRGLYRFAGVLGRGRQRGGQGRRDPARLRGHGRAHRLRAAPLGRRQQGTHPPTCRVMRESMCVVCEKARKMRLKGPCAHGPCVPHASSKRGAIRARTPTDTALYTTMCLYDGVYMGGGWGWGCAA